MQQPRFVPPKTLLFIIKLTLQYNLIVIRFLYLSQIVSRSGELLMKSMMGNNFNCIKFKVLNHNKVVFLLHLSYKWRPAHLGLLHILSLVRKFVMTLTDTAVHKNSTHVNYLFLCASLWAEWNNLICLQ